MTPGSRQSLERRAAEQAARLPDLVAAAQRAAQVVVAGRHARQKAGPSDRFWQFRDYTVGDPVSSIDWRQSARLERRLLVRQTEWEQPQTIMLWCGGSDDFDYASDGRDSKRFRGQVIALALGILALRSGERVGVWGSSEPSRTGIQHTTSLAESLLRTDADFSSLTPLPGATSLLVSDFHLEPDKLVQAFGRVRDTRGRALAVIVEDPAEEQFPFSGSTDFQSPQGLRRKRFGDAAAIREAYSGRRQAHLASLMSAPREPGEAVLHHITDQSLAPLLLSLIETVEGF